MHIFILGMMERVYLVSRLNLHRLISRSLQTGPSNMTILKTTSPGLRLACTESTRITIMKVCFLLIAALC